MSVQTQQFRVVGVNTLTGEDVSVVIDAATKAAAEVKADQMHIETTHIVRLKTDGPAPPDEYELFSSEAAEALAGNRTINLVEACVSHEASRQAQPASAGGSAPKQINAPIVPATPEPAENLVTAITRPNYAAPASRQESYTDQVSGLRAFSLVLLVLMGISAGAYFVLVHQPNAINAQSNELIFGQDLFSDVLEPASVDQPANNVRDAFNRRAANADPKPDGPPIALDQQLKITPQAEPASADGSASGSSPSKSKFKLQSIVTTNKGRFAVINGKLYEQGGSIGSAKLVSVADDWVLIERDGKQFTLKIQTSASK